MPGTSIEKRRRSRQYALNLTLATVTGQVGCLTTIIILGTLFLGLWIDNRFQTKPLFTIILLISSIPITLVLMLKIVKRVTSEIKPVIDQETENEIVQEETSSARNS